MRWLVWWLLSDFLFFIPEAVLWRNVQAVSPVPTVPGRVQALVGSCVVIPCSFTASPAAPRLFRGLSQRVDVRLRFKDGGPVFPLPSIAFNSESKNQVSRVFQGRTSLAGQTGDGDCSVKIEKVRRDDPQLLEVALKKGDDFLWGKSRSIRVNIIGECVCFLLQNTLYFQVFKIKKQNVKMSVFSQFNSP